ncbi:MAG: hypothetical protein AB7C95_04730 [Synergistaceae bacterium]
MKFCSRFIGFTTYVGVEQIKFRNGIYETADKKEIEALKKLCEKGDVFLPADDRRIESTVDDTAKFLTEWAKTVGVDTAGMNNEQIRTAIEEKLAGKPAE